MMSSLRRIIWIGSFPKSGNTWVRAFLGSYFENVSINNLSTITTTDVRPEWFNMAVGGTFIGKSFDDSVKLRPKVQRLIAASKPGSSFVITHSKVDRVGPIDLILPEVTAAAICIIRNPFDVAISFARHSSISIDTSIDRMSDNASMTASPTKIIDVLGRWDDHVQSWLKAPGLARHVMRYEDMLANPKKEFKGLLGFLQVPVENKKLRLSLENTSFKALQRQEKNQGFKERPAGVDQFFVSGKSGGWKDSLTVEQVARIQKEFGPTIDELFPEVAKEAAEFIAKAS